MEYHWNPSLISSDQDEMFEEPDVENSIHFGAPAHAWRYYGATDWYQERTKISQSVVNCEFSVCCSRGQSCQALVRWCLQKIKNRATTSFTCLIRSWRTKPCIGITYFQTVDAGVWIFILLALQIFYREYV
ncbi:uncharacterized protein LOC113334422 isoform X2 [Papaver somniferum]|uniref:uncharacterized protein LOC113334422 isoform X2 n=1 Tax=Papaver somniferum TaxID=3469 RepID=UPI000E6F51FE|nr:uncharacterized protein LOC113334422 isoform X2 [Papaver somniferum]